MQLYTDIAIHSSDHILLYLVTAIIFLIMRIQWQSEEEMLLNPIFLMLLQLVNETMRPMVVYHIVFSFDSPILDQKQQRQLSDTTIMLQGTQQWQSEEEIR